MTSAKILPTTKLLTHIIEQDLVLLLGILIHPLLLHPVRVLQVADFEIEQNPG
jgi:hypothetical protein